MNVLASRPTAEGRDGAGLNAILWRGGLGSVLLRAASTLLGLGVALVLARTLGADGYGVYAYALALVSLLAIPAQSGLPTIVLRETALADERGRYDVMLGVWRWSSRVVAGLSLCLVATALLVVAGLGDVITNHWLDTFYLGLLLVPLMGLVNLRGAALKGLGRVVVGQVPDSVLRPGLLLLLLLCAHGLQPEQDLSPFIAMGLHVLSLGIALLAAILVLREVRPDELKSSPNPVYQHGCWLRSMPPLALMAGIGVGNAYADVLILGWFRAIEEVGVYRVVASSVMFVGFGMQAINLAITPRLARLYARGDLDRLQRLESLSTVVMLLMAMPVFLAFVVWGDHLLAWMFGAEFAHGYVPLAILACGHLITVTMGSVGTIMNMANKEWPAARSTALSALANIVLCLLLVPALGMTGAALAGALSLVLWSVLFAYAIRRYVGIRGGVFGMIWPVSQDRKRDAYSQTP